MRWYHDRPFLRQLPWPYRLYAAYHRRTADPETGWLPRGHAVHAALRALGRRAGWRAEAAVEAGGVAVWVDLLDYQARAAFDELRRAEPGVRAVLAALRPGDTFVDVGANYGTFSLLAAARVRPGGRVYAVEPQPRHAALLRRSAARNGAGDRVRVFEAACAERAGEATVYVPDQSSGKASVHGAYAGVLAHRALAVRAETLDGLLDGHPLPGRVVVKVDVEGAERAVLRGARGVLGRHRPLLLFELHPRSSEAAGYRPEDLLAQVGALGYDRFREVGGHGWTPAEDVPTDRRRDVIALPASSDGWAERLDAADVP